MTTIGFIGLGNMGLPMASRLADAGHRLVVSDVSADAIARVGRGRPSVFAARDAGWAGVEILVLMLPDSRIVESVLLGDGVLDALDAASLVIDMSSSRPDCTRLLAQRIRATGRRFVDAPVSGGVKGAAAGTLATLVGGSAEDIDAARPVLDVVAGTVIHVGEVGSGHAAKALNNLVSAAGLSVTVEALRIARAFGIEPSTMTAVLNSSSGRTNTSENKVQQFMLNGSYGSGFAQHLMAKDIGIALELATAVGEPANVSHAVGGQWTCIAACTSSAVDHTEMYALIGTSAEDTEHEDD